MSNNRVVVISHEVVDRHLAGPGIRYRELARVLARHFEVILAIPSQTDLEGLPFAVWPYQRGQWGTLIRAAQQARVILACGDSLSDFPALARLNTPLVVDGYDPHSLETLALWAEHPVPFQAARHGERLDILRRQCQAGDFFICASERQRDWWLGLLEDQGRVNPHTFGADRSLRNLIDVVPYGLPQAPPLARQNAASSKAVGPVLRGVWPGVGPDDRIVLWGGGLWEWLDPLTALRAVRRLADDGLDVRLVFPGTRHPSPVLPDMPMRARTLALAEELGLTGRYAFFGDWVPYEDWPAVLLEADVGLSLHPDTVEARLAFRSRVLDYIGAGLPMVVTRGDSAADLVEDHTLGLVVNYEDDAAVAAALADLFRADRPALRDAYHERFDAARRDLTWERAAEPLVAFCHEPHLAADKTPHAVSQSALPRSAAGTAVTGVEPTPASVPTLPGEHRPGLAARPESQEEGAKHSLSISVIVLAWNGAAYIKNCLEALMAQDYPAVEVLVVDNGSTDGTPDIVAQRFPQVRLICNRRNLGFAAGNNVGLGAASGDLLVLLNVDTHVHAGWLAALAGAFEDPSIGIAGCKLLYPDGSIQHAGGFVYGPRGEAEHLGRYALDDGRFGELADVEFVTGAALAIRRTTLDKIGLLDEGFSPIYYEDIDWCYQVRAAGWRVVYLPQAVVTHYESTTFGAETYERKFALHQGRLRFLFKHRPVEWLLDEFGPAEKAWIASMDRNDELMAVRHVCLVMLLNLPGILAYRSGFPENAPEDAHALVGLLTDLRAAAVAGLAVLQVPAACQAPPLPTRPQPLPVPEEAASLADVDLDHQREAGWAQAQPSIGPEEAASLTDVDLDHQREATWARAQSLIELEAAQIIRERPFVSKVPVLGRFIVAVRDLWNSVATKWYVRPLIQQQTDFNIQVVRYLAQIEQLYQTTEQLGKTIERICQSTEQLGRTAEEHGAMIGWLSRRADQLEVWSARQEHFLSGQVRDVAENIRELTALAKQVARVEKPEEGVQN